MWTNYGASASFIYTIDGGSNQTAPASPTGTANVAYKISVTGQTNAPHTLILNAPTSGGGCFWYGVDVKGASATGVRVHRLAKSGAKTPDALDIGLTDSFTGVAPLPARAYQNVFGPNGAAADLVIIALGSNDCGSAGQTVSPTQFKANLQIAITYITTVLNKCVLLYSEPRRAVPNGLPFAETDYYATMVQLSDANDHVAYLDVQQAFGTYAQGSASDINRYIGDGIHPNRRGHGVIARTLYRALSAPARYPGT